MKNLYLLPTEKPSRLIKSQDNDFVYLNTNAPNWFENNLKTIKQNIYITNDETIKLGEWVIYTKGIKIHFKKLDNKEDVELANIENSGVLKIILTTDQELIKDGVQAIDDEFLEWFVKNPSCEEVEIEKENEDLIPYGNQYVNLSKIDSACIKSNFLPQNSKSIRPPKLVKCCKTNLIFETKYRHDLYPGYYDCKPYKLEYKIIIPKEEAKQVGQITEKGIIDIIGNCANCGIEFHIHKDIEEPKQETLEEVAYKLFSTMPSEISTSTAKSKALELAKWQQEQDKNKFSEEEVLQLLLDCRGENPIDIEKWFEQNKKK